MKKIFVLFLVVGLSFWVTGIFAQQSTSEKQIKIEEKKEAGEVDELEDIENPDADFKVELWTGRKDSVYKVGEEIVFFFKAQKDCRLTLFNIGTSGKVYIIFPNKHQEDNLVKAGKVYRVPAEKARWVFKASGPAGKELVKAIATLEKTELVSDKDTKPAGVVQEVTAPESQISKDIAIALKPVETKKWAEAAKTLEVKEKD